MADQKLSALSAIPQADMDDTVLLYVVDTIAGNVSNKVTKANFFAGTKKTILTLTLPSGPTGSSSSFHGALNVPANTVTFATTAQTGDYNTNRIDQATLVNPSSGTITNAATLKILGAPIASTNVTITNAYALWVAAGTTLLQATTVAGTLTMSSADIAVGTNNITFDGIFKMAWAGSGQNATIVYNSGGGNSPFAFQIGPGGTSVNAYFQVFRTSTYTTNIEYLAIGSDIEASAGFDIVSTQAGTGTIRPIRVYMAGTKLLSFDTANTITFYQNLVGSGASLVPAASTGSAVFGLDWSGASSNSISNNATVTPFGNSNNFAGLLWVYETNGGRSALLLVDSAGISIIKQNGTTFTVTSGTASSINVYLNSNVVTIENKTGSTDFVRVMGMRFATNL